MTASSAHPGGVNASLLDGTVRFIPDTIHTDLDAHRRFRVREHWFRCTCNDVAVAGATSASAASAGNSASSEEESEGVEVCEHTTVTRPSPRSGCGCRPALGSPTFPTGMDGVIFSYGVWAELGAVNSREVIPSL